MTMSAPTLEKILQAVNEKYGTSFEGWSQLPTVYEVGDTVPNWNAYEKIEMPETKEYLAINFGNWCAGYIKNEDIYLYGDTSSEYIIVCNADGVVYQGRGALLNNELKTVLTGKVHNAGIQFNEFIVIETPFSSGETVENWENYRKIS